MDSLDSAVSILRNRKQDFDYGLHKRVAPSTQGLYAFWLEDNGACLYVGMGNLSRRIRQHRAEEHNRELERYFKAFGRQIKISYAILDGCPERELRALEKETISVLRPITNKQR